MRLHAVCMPSHQPQLAHLSCTHITMMPAKAVVTLHMVQWQCCTVCELHLSLTIPSALQVTHDISHLTCADVFRAPGVQTPVITRFSTVIHERGSPEAIRDPRGFAVKFYTREGNWDLVGNNMPVFFIRDGIKFPDMIHALKPNPKNHIQEDWRIADFFSHVPEAMHMVSMLLRPRVVAAAPYSACSWACLLPPKSMIPIRAAKFGCKGGGTLAQTIACRTSGPLVVTPQTQA